MKFGISDVVIDMVCFRKLGHNEQDDSVRYAAADVQENRTSTRARASCMRTSSPQRARSPRSYGDDLVTKAYRAASGRRAKAPTPRFSTASRPPLAVDWAPYMNGQGWRAPRRHRGAAGTTEAHLWRTFDADSVRFQGATCRSRNCSSNASQDGQGEIAARLGHGRKPRLRIAGREAAYRCA